MDYNKFMHSLAMVVIIGFSSTVAIAQESESTAYDSMSDSAIIPVEKEPEWQLSVVAGGISKHLSDEYKPSEGYTETHSSLGLEIGQADPGWAFSAQAFRFNDSYDEDSFLAIGAFGYRVELPYQFFLYGGVGAGIVDTSYYSGGIALPLLELGWRRVSVQGSYLPKLDGADEVIAAQFKFKVLEW